MSYPRRSARRVLPASSFLHPLFSLRAPLAKPDLPWQVAPLRRSATRHQERAFMPIYEFDGVRPEFPPDGQSWVAGTAVLIGRVRLLAEASVWWNAVLRGDNEWIEIGVRSQVQDNATLHTDPGYPLTIGSDCVIGHNVILHGCTVGSRCLIGMGAIVMNGVRINHGSIVGAGAVIPEGREFPEYSLIIGAPARVARTLDEKAAKSIAAGADNYVRRWKAYANGLKAIG
jgi:carbonic anhydrase/acetyltransferase-like protein (isoleucine patch superfamily)